MQFQRRVIIIRLTKGKILMKDAGQPFGNEHEYFIASDGMMRKVNQGMISSSIHPVQSALRQPHTQSFFYAPYNNKLGHVDVDNGLEHGLYLADQLEGPWSLSLVVG